MSATHSVPTRELSFEQKQPVAAIVYANGVYPDAIFEKLVGRSRGLGLSLAGVLQHPAFEGADRRCDVLLEDLTSGHRTILFEDRGVGASGCRLDQGALAEVTARIEGSLERTPDLLILTKFGKVESEGGGLRDLIASAIDRGIPVIIGVPRRNLADWRSFAGDLAVELCADDISFKNWLMEGFAGG